MPAAELHELLSRKLAQCGVMFDFLDCVADLKGKEVKRAALNELVECVGSTRGVLIEPVYPDIIRMVSTWHPTAWGGLGGAEPCQPLYVFGSFTQSPCPPTFADVSLKRGACTSPKATPIPGLHLPCTPLKAQARPQPFTAWQAKAFPLPISLYPSPCRVEPQFPPKASTNQVFRS